MRYVNENHVTLLQPLIFHLQIIALHFAVNLAPGFDTGFFGVGPQFYMACFNFKVTGDGTSTPKGVTFPGGYTPEEPGFRYDVSANSTNSSVPYPPVGPALYKSARSVSLAPKDRVVVSPTGNGSAADTAYFNNQYQILLAQGNVTSFFDSIGG